jgi:hypothetical protein
MRLRVAFVLPTTLQPDRMPRVKPVRRSINCLPARRPFTGVMIVRGGVQSQSGNHCEGVTLARVNGNPSAGAAFTVAAKFG